MELQQQVPQPSTEEAIAAVEGVVGLLWKHGKIEILPPEQFQLLLIAWESLKIKARAASQPADAPADALAVVPPLDE